MGTRQVAAAASVLNSKANSTDDPTGDMIETESNSTEACVDEYPPDVDTQYTCEDQAGFGKCEENWMNGYCQFSCGKCESDQVKAEGEASSSGDEEEEVS